MTSKSSKIEISVCSSNISETSINLKQITAVSSLNDNQAIGDHFKKTNFGQYINKKPKVNMYQGSLTFHEEVIVFFNKNENKEATKLLENQEEIQSKELKSVLHSNSFNLVLEQDKDLKPFSMESTKQDQMTSYIFPKVQSSNNTPLLSSVAIDDFCNFQFLKANEESIKQNNKIDQIIEFDFESQINNEKSSTQVHQITKIVNDLTEGNQDITKEKKISSSNSKDTDLE